MDTYKTCVMVTGVTFTVAEQVAAYETIEEEYQVGFNLDCGFWSCWKVPKYATRKTKIPVFNRRTLSLKKQKDLHTWMLQQAVESAGHLVSIGPASGDANDRSLSGTTDSSAWNWKSPQYTYDKL